MFPWKAPSGKVVSSLRSSRMYGTALRLVICGNVTAIRPAGVFPAAYAPNGEFALTVPVQLCARKVEGLSAQINGDKGQMHGPQS